MVIFECVNASLLCTGGRKLMDIRSKQEQSLEQQRLTTKEAEHLHLDMMGRKIETRVQVGEREREEEVVVEVVVEVEKEEVDEGGGGGGGGGEGRGGGRGGGGGGEGGGR